GVAPLAPLELRLGAAATGAAARDAWPGVEPGVAASGAGSGASYFTERIEVRAAAAGAGRSAREIRESLARDVGDALAEVPGAARIRKGGLAHDVVVRGAKGDDVVMQIDGQPLHGACPNRMDPPIFHVDFAEVERVELALGPFDV